MEKRVSSRPIDRRKQRVGRKALASLRMVQAIERRQAPQPKAAPNSTKPARTSLLSRVKRWQLAAVAALVLVVGAGSYIIPTMLAQKSDVRAATAPPPVRSAQAQQEHNACLARVTAANKDKLGKVTYNQLYGDQCK